MGNTSSERAAMGQGEKAQRRDSRGTKEGERPKILMDSPEDADIFHGEDMKAPLEKEEFLAWQQDLEADDKGPTLDRPTVFRWTGDGKEVYLSGSFNNWANKIPLIRSQNTFVAIVDLPEGEHQYKFYVDGQWTHDPAEPVITSQLGTVNNVIQVKKTDFEVFDALMVDSQKCSDMSDLSSSPPGPYHQDAYIPKQEEKFKSPPILPPHLLQVILNKDTGISCDPALLPEPNHVMLNHLYALSIKDGVMVLSATHRYKKKYVTTLLYKPIWLNTDFSIPSQCVNCTPSVQNISSICFFDHKEQMNAGHIAHEFDLLTRPNPDLKINTQGFECQCVTTCVHYPKLRKASSHLDSGMNLRLWDYILYTHCVSSYCLFRMIKVTQLLQSYIIHLYLFTDCPP